MPNEYSPKKTLQHFDLVARLQFRIEAGTAPELAHIEDPRFAATKKQSVLLIGDVDEAADAVEAWHWSVA